MNGLSISRRATGRHSQWGANSPARTLSPIPIRPRLWAASIATLALAASIVAPLVASAQEPATEAPWNGQPISKGLGPTYNDPWCAEAATGTSIANQQGAPLALIPQEAIGCTIEKIEAEGVAAGLPDRMDHFVIGKSAGGRDIHAWVVNALETPEQRRDYERWRQIRAIELKDPAAAQALLASFGGDVKMPVFVQNNIHGNEEEGADALMQVLRDLVTTPRGTNQTVDDILDHVILVSIASINPDGRFAGTRANGNNFDMNRDWLVQSQAEVRASVKLQQQWLATVGLDTHGYVDPTLVDGLTKPHNPGLEYDIFLKWNQPRLDSNEADLGGLNMGITRPVNEWNSAGTEPGNPALAEGWDDWGPFYTQTYMAFYGVDSSTVEMCSLAAEGPCDGRLGSKIAQYLTFYSSVNKWIPNRQQMMHDQLEVFRRGVTGALRGQCCAAPDIADRGFTEDQHNWMVEYPKAFIIPFESKLQRSDGEANRLVRWLLDNGIRVHRATKSFKREGVTYPADSYVVFMNQPLRGLALTALSAGQDISDRIIQLYATPAAWSHGLLWGADVVPVAAGGRFSPATKKISSPQSLSGGIRGGVDAAAKWYAVTPRGASDHRAIVKLLRAGVTGEVAEAAFSTTTGGSMPAGSVIFDNTSLARRKQLHARGKAAGLVFERNKGSSKPAGTRLQEAPKVAILVNSASPAPNDTSQSLKAIFGADAEFVSVTNGANSLANAAEDPLLAFDVIYNTGQTWPGPGTAQDRLNAFFARGGGYLATGQSAANFAFLTGGGLVSGSLTHGSQTAYGGIAIWENAGGAGSPLTGVYPASDFLYLPSNITYFSTTPDGSTIDGTYHADMAGSVPGMNGPSAGFVAGLWRTRLPAANDAPVIVRGTTTPGSRYMALSTNPFSRQDAEREWALIAQAAMWSNLTDDPAAARAAAAEQSSSTPGWSLPAGVQSGGGALPSLAGEYRGEWRASDGSWGYIDAVLTQHGSVLAGKLALPAAEGCTSTRQLAGQLSGPEVSMTAGGASLDGVAEGGTISGMFTDSCSGADGTFEMYQEETRAAD